MVNTLYVWDSTLAHCRTSLGSTLREVKKAPFSLSNVGSSSERATFLQLTLDSDTDPSEFRFLSLYFCFYTISLFSPIARRNLSLNIMDRGEKKTAHASGISINREAAMENIQALGSWRNKVSGIVETSICYKRTYTGTPKNRMFLHRIFTSFQTFESFVQ